MSQHPPEESGQDAAAPPPLPQPAPLPDPGPMPDPARLYETETSRTYPCQSCGANLVYDPRSQQLRCRFCATTQAIEVEDGLPDHHDLVSSVNTLRAAGTQQVEPQQLSRELVCQSCGGTTAFDGSMTSSRCPYCNTPIQRDDFHDAPTRLPIDGVLPFRVDEDQAREHIETWINKRWFAPKEFKTYREIGSFSSIYLTYFNYVAKTVTEYSGRRGDNYTRTVGSGDDRRTVTDTRWRHAAGTIEKSFVNLPEYANTGLDRDKVEELEPWPLAEAKRYSPQFVAGHLAKTYDEDPGERFDKGARPRIDDAIELAIRQDIGGDRQEISAKRTQFTMLQFTQLLLPVWLLTVTFEGQPFQVFINGVTGEVQGQRPWSKVKIGLTAAVALIVVVTLWVIFGR